jgi:hypothetical protein
MADVTEPPSCQPYAADAEGTSVPVGVDPTVPSPARMYDYYLGGSTNYAADRDAAKKALSVVPSGQQIARANRYFLMRAVLLMADQGIGQFIDVGTGIPTSPNVHEIAQAIHPDARVLYIDNDPVVTAYNKASLAAIDNVTALEADIRDPDSILNSRELRKLIDFRKPVGILFVAVLHFVRDDEDPRHIVSAFTRHMKRGSYLALSHIASDGASTEVMTTIQDAYAHASAPAVFRTELEIGSFFSGFELVHPGLAEVRQWFPYAAMFPTQPSALRFLAGLGRKVESGEVSIQAKTRV